VATIDKKIGQIVDRAAGRRPLYYCVGNKSAIYMNACLQAHEAIVEVLTPKARDAITSAELKAAVLAYVACGKEGKKKLLQDIAMAEYGALRNGVKIEKLVDTWFQHKIAGGITEKWLLHSEFHKKIFLDFFSQNKVRTTADLDPDTAYKFMAWRKENSYAMHNPKKSDTSASTIKQNLQELKQMARIAARYGWIANAGIWDDAEVKIIAGVNVKIVEPLPVDLQKEILATLRGRMPWMHDVVLFLLTTGVRLGEMELMKEDSIKNNAITLHGDGIGFLKSATGKTASAARTLPVCPTVAKIFERGYIFNVSGGSLRNALKRDYFARKHPGIHPHRLRHTFAVNKLLSQAATLQMVSYQLGHKDINITANLYGKFVPEHFKVGFEAAIKERRELVEWLENGYFS
jgi:integrase